jgi:peptidoglycan hydrolase-like protein with peptidoglycan-binding domain/biotin carboxyl carrier protein
MRTIPEKEIAVSVEDQGEGGSTADEEPTKRSRRRWIVLVLVVAAAVVVGWLIARSGTPETEITAATEVSFSEVMIRDLEQIEELSGTLGFDAGEPISSRFSGTLTSSVEAGDVVGGGDVLFTVDNQPVVLLHGSDPMYRDLAIGDETVPVVGRLSGPITEIVEPGTIVEQGDVLYRADGEPVVVLYGDTLAYRTLRDASTNLTGADVEQLEAALVTLGYDPDGTVTVDNEFTYNTEQIVEAWQSDIGADDDGVVNLGEVVFLPGPALVLESSQLGDTAGPNAPVVTLLTGDSLNGSDVEQLEAALTDEGLDPGDVDGTFTTETQQALIAWQQSIGMEPDGVVNVGGIVFLPDSIRIAAVNVTVGSSVNPGTPVLATSSDQSVVAVDLAARDQGLLAEGDEVTVVLPNDVEASATVTYVAPLATVSGAGPEQQATFEILIELDDHSVAVGFDEAPVDVLVITDQRLDALTVPVGSLLALAEGGYAVEVDRGNGQTALVAVDPGMYADGYVEIEAEGLQPGDRVVMPR